MAPGQISRATPVGAGARRACAKCGHQHIACNSCKNRHCSKCRGPRAAKGWMAVRAEDLLLVEYFHVVFPLPTEIVRLAYANTKALYRLPSRASAETVTTIAADPRHLVASRHDQRAPHLGIGDDPPSACPHDHPRRRAVVRRHPMDPLPPRVLPVRPGSCRGCSAASSWKDWRHCTVPARWRSSSGPRRCWSISAATPTASSAPTPTTRSRFSYRAPPDPRGFRHERFPTRADMVAGNQRCASARIGKPSSSFVAPRTDVGCRPIPARSLADEGPVPASSATAHARFQDTYTS